MQIYFKNILNLNKTITSKYLDNYDYPEVLGKIQEIILNLIKTLDLDKYNVLDNNIYIHKSVIIPKTATICGPCLIDENTEIRPGAYIRGNVVIGKNCVIGNSTEIKNSILFDNVQVPHFNYIGDSILGYKSHFGAGSLTSNVKSDHSNIKLKYNDLIEQTNLKKIGSVIGNNVEIGCNAVLLPGTIIGENTTIYPLTMVRGEIKSNKIVKSMNNIIEKEKRSI